MVDAAEDAGGAFREICIADSKFFLDKVVKGSTLSSVAIMKRII